jgi:hypothetical protein
MVDTHLELSALVRKTCMCLTSRSSRRPPQTNLVASSAPSIKETTASRNEATAKARLDARRRAPSSRLPSAGMCLKRSAAIASKKASILGALAWIALADIPRRRSHSRETVSTISRSMESWPGLPRALCALARIGTISKVCNYVQCVVTVVLEENHFTSNMQASTKTRPPR